VTSLRCSNVLVTGHHGYIGSAIVPMLLAAGNEVVGVDTFLYEGCDLLADRTAVESIRADVRDLHESHLDGIDAIVHLAALSNDPLGELDPALTHGINYEATVSLARLARARGIERFVFASSCSMYGAAETSAAVDETAPLAPLTAYAKSKVLSEEALRELADDGFSPVSLRNATAFGASPRLRMDIVLNNLVGWAVTSGRVRLMSDGSAWRPLVHVEDIGRAVLAVLDAPIETIHGQAFNVGSEPENHRIVELAEIVRATVPDTAVEIADRGVDARSYRVDFSKFADSFPAHTPTWTAARGARELFDAYRAAGLEPEAMDGDRFIRLNRLRRLIDEGLLDARLRWRMAATASRS
jgi:nucleoside-diphosphate-sugar epimerase